ncbi:MAG: lamin tail domain-containing protein [Stygiobacter sp.]
MSKLVILIGVIVFSISPVIAQSPVVINEVLFDVPSGTIGDANKDFSRSPRADEFIEIVNTGTGSVDISGWQILERNRIAVFTFPANIILGPKEPAVVFGGVDPVGFSGFPAELKLFAAKFGEKDSGFAITGKSNLSNSNDNVILVNPAKNDTIAEVFWGTAVAQSSKGVKLAAPNTVDNQEIKGAIGMSVTRAPDLTGKWARHRNVAKDSAYYSVGTSIKGGSFLTTLIRDYTEIIPRAFSLHQNYPNPFNPSTVIRFELVRSEYVTLVVYDLLGNGIHTLVSRHLEVGSYNVKWEPNGLASGVYIYTLKAGNYVQSKKMILMR